VQTVTGRALTTILQRAGYQAERIRDDAWMIDGEEKTPEEANAMANAWRAENGVGAIKLARA
jgi:hypothetical protein